LPDDFGHAVFNLSNRPESRKLMSITFCHCVWKPLRAVKLARILNSRHEQPVRDHLKLMIPDGTLECSIPNMPNHPNQRYKSAQT